ncbi:hypothetical protein KIN20_013075 [Parelaphostrongylus tenuis]|uniref:Uncharacterized protein n=1 Tax=Parelaphostrongylus tenuis TaxID=148309 RepID=A0AAD5MG34_PARTN|nr:hypothetical protein KIN20_013075 [Parelaphostrongylus tenuis]
MDSLMGQNVLELSPVEAYTCQYQNVEYAKDPVRPKNLPVIAGSIGFNACVNTDQQRHSGGSNAGSNHHTARNMTAVKFFATVPFFMGLVSAKRPSELEPLASLCNE